jgi:hypothetical protein
MGREPEREREGERSQGKREWEGGRVRVSGIEEKRERELPSIL